MKAHLATDPDRRGWVVMSEEETVLFGPAWSMTALSTWCRENDIELEGVTSGKEQREEPDQRILRKNNRKNAGQQSSATNSEQREEKEEEVTKEQP